MSNCNTYGGLYQWDEAMQYVINEGVQGICPSGWHIPSWEECEILRVSVDNDGNTLKEIGEGVWPGKGNKRSGFSALLTGYRRRDPLESSAPFTQFSVYTFYWASIESTGANATR